MRPSREVIGATRTQHRSRIFSLSLSLLRRWKRDSSSGKSFASALAFSFVLPAAAAARFRWYFEMRFVPLPLFPPLSVYVSVCSVVSPGAGPADNFRQATAVGSFGVLLRSQIKIRSPSFARLWEWERKTTPESSSRTSLDTFFHFWKDFPHTFSRSERERERDR